MTHSISISVRDFIGRKKTLKFSADTPSALEFLLEDKVDKLFWLIGACIIPELIVTMIMGFIWNNQNADVLIWYIIYLPLGLLFCAPFIIAMTFLSIRRDTYKVALEFVCDDNYFTDELKKYDMYSWSDFDPRA